MRKVYCYLAIVLALALFAGCRGEKEPADMPYEIIEENGTYYIILGEELKEWAEAYKYFEMESAALRSAPVIQFESVSEMKHKTETGELTESELRQLAQFPADDAGRIPIMDLSNLYQPGYPSTFDKLEVNWRGSTYDFYFRSSDDSLFCDLQVLPSKERWREMVDSWCGFRELDDIEVTDQTRESERDAEVISYKTASGQHQKVYYTIQNGNDILHVFESYDVVEEEPKLTDIDLCGFTNGYYFDAEINASYPLEYFERPSVEWLSEFEMMDYEEEPSWLLPVGLGCAVLVVGAGVGVLVLRLKKKKASIPASDGEAEM